jgi:DHA1 family tetracycline resistance protein-like MFS transporter
MRLLLLLASAAAISKVPKAPTAGRKAAQAQATQAKPLALTGGAKQKQAVQPLAIAGGGNKKQVSYAWAVLHNWLYFLSLGLCIPVLPKVIASTVNDDGAAVITSKSARVAGDVEGVDKLLTFLFVGALGACSDGVGRKPLIALSALGYATTVLVQARATKVAHFFAADAIDGLTSCMNAVCAAFVADATAQDSGAARAAALGVFQGLSVGGAFIVGFPMAAILSKGGKYRKPMYLAASLQLLNAFLALFVTPESAPKSKGIKWDEANPISSLGQLDLFKASTPLKKTAIAFSLVWLGNLALNACFVPYVDAKFGWGPQQSGPLLVVVGLMLAVVPKLVVPRLGVVGAANFGCLVYALGFICAALAPTGPQYVAAIVVCGFGAVAVPALTSTAGRKSKLSGARHRRDTSVL